RGAPGGTGDDQVEQATPDRQAGDGVRHVFSPQIRAPRSSAWVRKFRKGSGGPGRGRGGSIRGLRLRAAPLRPATGRADVPEGPPQAAGGGRTSARACMISTLGGRAGRG